MFDTNSLRTPDRPPAAGVQEVLVFEVEELRCALPLAEVERVFLLPATDPLPGAPPWVLGICHLAREAVPIIDLTLRLGLPRATPYPLDAPVILCGDGERRGALIVDRVAGLLPLPAGQHGALPGEAGAYPLFRGVLHAGDDRLLLLDTRAALSVTPLRSERPVEAYLLSGGPLHGA